MNNYKNKNIFDNFNYFKNNSTIKNIFSYFGYRVIDLYTHFPLLINKNNLIEILNNNHLEKIISVDLNIVKYIENFNKRSPFRIICENEKSQVVEILFFNMNKYQIQNYLKLNQTYRITGKLTITKESFQIIHPTNILKSSEFHYYDFFEPQYDLVRKKINKKSFRKIIKDNLNIIKDFEFPEEWIHEDYKQRNWKSFKESIFQLHLPETIEDIKKSEIARKRLAFDELLSSYLTFYELKKKFDQNYNLKGISNFSFSLEIINTLPFILTKDQKKCIREIKQDLSSNNKMYRLVQGDVGSGKTIIALLMVADIVKNGYQAVVMAPTEILAKQHYKYFKDYLSKFNITIEIITGKTSAKIKKRIYENITSNKIEILIGTHSVYNESVQFKNLGLIVIDEQHKFGVKQRINLLEKAIGCHTLIMSATPIPRSLSFAMYGEISISNIKTKPSERKEVVTSIISTKNIVKLLEGINRKIERKEQVFWILPTIGTLDSEKETLLTRFEFLKKRFKEKVGILHGKIKKDDSEKIMNDFREKKILILVSTTVIEVGINIPNATLMIVEQAEKFGLAQLHQLRGRISRGSLQSHCVLIYSQNLSDNTKERLLTLKKNSDGFDIAEKDLYLRGAGDFFGTNQSGLPTWKFFKPYEDHMLIKFVKKNSEHLIKNYPLNRQKILFLKKVFYKERDFKNYFSV